MVALFDDGSYTNEFSGVLANGVAAFRAEKPTKWGTYQIY